LKVVAELVPETGHGALAGQGRASSRSRGVSTFA
jgi:hypothetical protein